MQNCKQVFGNELYETHSDTVFGHRLPDVFVLACSTVYVTKGRFSCHQVRIRLRRNLGPLDGQSHKYVYVEPKHDLSFDRKRPYLGWLMV